jgi:acyl CoA:acetate/3-ketoacid CoA transferase alpha subunit/acyl CoA:acetate/3-ketoacid CoA transferase beta subunit
MVSKNRKGKIMSLKEACKLVNDSDLIVCGGEFNSRPPMAIIRELIRQRKKDLTIVGHAQGILPDLACGAGIVKEIQFTRASLEREFGEAPNYRRAVESGKVVARDACCGIMNQQLRASAFGLPWMPVNPHLLYTDYLKMHPEWKVVDDPYSGDGKIVLVPAMKADVAIIHASLADFDGNWAYFGECHYDYLYVHAAEKVIVTVENIVSPEEFRNIMCNVMNPFVFPPRLDPAFPWFMTDAVVHVPFGAHPGFCYPHYTYDIEHIREYLEYSRGGPEKFKEYLDKYVYSCETQEEYLEKIGGVKKLIKLSSWRNEVLALRSMKEKAARGERVTGEDLTRAGVRHFLEPSEEFLAVGKKEYTIAELMPIVMARLIEDGEFCVHGGDSQIPAVALRLAKCLHAPNIVHMGGITGSINPSPDRLITNTNDIWYFQNAEFYYPFTYVFDLWEKKKIDVMFLGGAQIDKYGNVNATLLGSINNVKVKLPGGGGTCNIYGSCKKIILWTTRHERRGAYYTLVDKVDFITGHGNVPEARGTGEIGPYKCVTDLCVFGFDSETGIMRLEALYPDVTVDKVLENTGFTPIIPDKVPTIEPPTQEELDILRTKADPTAVRRMEFTPEQLKRRRFSL